MTSLLLITIIRILNSDTMDLYRSTFAGAILLNSVVFYRSYRTKIARVGEENAEKVDHRGRDDDDERLSFFKWRFFVVYLLVNGADWLQGPYIYPIYKGTWTATRRTGAVLKRSCNGRMMLTLE
jgi:hypothetical protein